jgi:hypothetical protein
MLQRGDNRKSAGVSDLLEKVDKKVKESYHEDVISKLRYE